MTKSSWGTKRNCPACHVAFYDLNHAKIICPKCKKEFDPATLVRPKRKIMKKGVKEEKVTPIKPSIIAAVKKLQQAKKKKDSEDDGGEGIGTLMEMGESDEIDNLQEISELEEIEASPVNEDDADEEALIEDLDTGGNVIVGNVEEEEAEVLIEEIKDEQDEGVKKKKKKK